MTPRGHPRKAEGSGMNEDRNAINQAFSRAAEKYDKFAVDHPHLTRMRNKVYQQVQRHIPPGAHILELNSGTGTDAAELVRRGYRLHATDISEGMLARVEQKSTQIASDDVFTFQRLSYTELQNVENAPFDAVFSNLGGLNCIQDLGLVIAKLPQVLKPGGVVIWVLMPPFCIWEFATILLGQFELAFRRFSKDGVIAHLEGHYFPVYYFKPRDVIRALGPGFEILDIRGLSVITPTAESKNFAIRFPRIYRALAWLDDRLSPRWPWYGWGDFYILTFQSRRE